MPRFPGVFWITLHGLAACLLCGSGGSLAAEGTHSTPAAISPRHGVVRLDGWSLCDDGGPFLGLGASYFQALRHAKYDRRRLESNLELLGSHGFNYVRVLSMVGWEGLEIAPVSFTGRTGRRVEAWPDYWLRFRELLEIAARSGLRVAVTVFADAQDVMPGGEARRAHLEALLKNLAGHESRVLYVEVANEAWQNGFPGPSGVAELRALAGFLGERTPVPVAITSNEDTSDSGILALHAGSGADLATVHFSRDTRTPEGGWFPVRDCFRVGRLPGVPPVVSNEPIGPGASVNSESDPIKLCSAAVFAYLAGLPAYVFHSSAGVYARDRFEAMPGLGAFRFLPQLLPGSLANWERHDGREASAPFTAYGDDLPNRFWPEVPHATTGCHRNIGSIRGKEFVCFPMGVLPGGVVLEARRALRCRVADPLQGRWSEGGDLPAGARLTLPQGSGAWVVRGTFLDAPSVSRREVPVVVPYPESTR